MSIGVSGELVGGEIKAGIMADLAARMEAFADPRVSIGLDLVLLNPDHVPSLTYTAFKKKAASQLGILASVHTTYPDGAHMLIDAFNASEHCRGVVVQLPFEDGQNRTVNDVLALVAPEKDVDGLRPDHDSPFSPATPRAILRLLEGNGIDVAAHTVVVSGQGRLVGAPLLKVLTDGGADAMGIDVDTPELERADAINSADIIITAMGQPQLLTPDLFVDMSRPKVLIDAGTAEKDGVTHGDVSDELREQALQHGWAINAAKGSVGPLTVATLMENVVISAERHFAAVS